MDMEEEVVASQVMLTNAVGKVTTITCAFCDFKLVKKRHWYNSKYFFREYNTYPLRPEIIQDICINHFEEEHPSIIGFWNMIKEEYSNEAKVVFRVNRI
jgi:hypothetical protein